MKGEKKKSPLNSHRRLQQSQEVICLPVLWKKAKKSHQEGKRFRIYNSKEHLVYNTNTVNIRTSKNCEERAEAGQGGRHLHKGYKGELSRGISLTEWENMNVVEEKKKHQNRVHSSIWPISGELSAMRPHSRQVRMDSMLLLAPLSMSLPETKGVSKKERNTYPDPSIQATAIMLPGVGSHVKPLRKV